MIAAVFPHHQRWHHKRCQTMQAIPEGPMAARRAKGSSAALTHFQLPPTKNLRAMVADLCGGGAGECVRRQAPAAAWGLDSGGGERWRRQRGQRRRCASVRRGLQRKAIKLQ